MLIEWLLLALTVVILIFMGVFKPQGLIVLLIASVALEISSMWYPEIPQLPAALGMITLARLTTYTLILSAFLRVIFNPAYRKRFVEILTQPLTWTILIYFIIAVGSYNHTIDKHKTIVEGVRLLVFIALFFSVILLARFRFNPLIPFHMVHLVGLGLAPITFYERFTGNLIWMQINAQGDFLRINATFVDPNIFARFLVLAVASNLLLQFLANTSSERRLYLFSLVIILGELVVTMSRGGIVTLAVVMLFMLIMLRSKVIAIPVGIFGALGIGAILMNPSLLQRFLKIKTDLTAYGSERLYLIQVGIQMFKDNPIWGVGLGGFEKKFLTRYIDFKSVGDGVTLSHTSVITVIAELGWVGIISFALFILSLIYTLFRLSQTIRHTYILGIGYFSWILTIFISAQMEARFFEDPLLWVSMGMLLSLLINSKEKHFITPTTYNRTKPIR